MRVLHAGTLDVRAGGPAVSTYNTLYGLCQAGVQAEVAMYALPTGCTLSGDEVPVHFIPAPWEERFAYSPSYKKCIRALGAFDVYHAQGIWQYPTYAIADIARERQKPYLISPRGMLYPQDIAKSNARFKRWSLKYRLLNDLNHAACIHATCEEEMQHCRNLGITAPIAVIPNPIRVKEYAKKASGSAFRLGYVGRLSPRKNVQSLIYAFAELKAEMQNAELWIIGGGDCKYENFLMREVDRLRLQNVHFTGFLSGEEKDEAIASLTALAMPSEFENFGNVILEALLRGVPCIATWGSPWKDLENYQCGYWIPYAQEAITGAVRKLLALSPSELREMGENGKRLVRSKYSIETVALKMKQLYAWVCGLGERPEYVYL